MENSDELLVSMIDMTSDITQIQNDLNSGFDAVENALCLDEYIRENGKSDDLRELVGEEALLGSALDKVKAFFKWLWEKIKALISIVKKFAIRFGQWISSFFKSVPKPKKNSQLPVSPNSCEKVQPPPAPDGISLESQGNNIGSTKYKHEKDPRYVNVTYHAIRFLATFTKVFAMMRFIRSEPGRNHTSPISKPLTVNSKIGAWLFDKSESSLEKCAEYMRTLLKEDKNAYYHEKPDSIKFTLLFQFATQSRTLFNSIASHLEKVEILIHKYVDTGIFAFKERTDILTDVSYNIALMTEYDPDKITNTLNSRKDHIAYLRTYMTNLTKACKSFQQCVQCGMIALKQYQLEAVRLEKEAGHDTATPFTKNYEISNNLRMEIKRGYDLDYFKRVIMPTDPHLIRLKDDLKSTSSPSERKELRKEYAKTVISKFNEFEDKTRFDLHSIAFNSHASSRIRHTTEYSTGIVQAGANSGGVVCINVDNTMGMLSNDMRNYKDYIGHTRYTKHTGVINLLKHTNAKYPVFIITMLHEFKHYWDIQNRVMKSGKRSGGNHAATSFMTWYDNYGALKDEYEADLAAALLPKTRLVISELDKIAETIHRDVTAHGFKADDPDKLKPLEGEARKKAAEKLM